MKTKAYEYLQRVGRSFMLPIAVLPIAGLLMGVGTCLTNEATISSLHLETFIGQGTFFNNILMILTNVGSAIFDNLPLIFAASLALGMAKKEKGVAALSAIVAFFVMHTTINGMLVIDGQVLAGQIVGENVLDGTISSVCGIMSLEMGVFGGVIVGIGVSVLHNCFYRIELPNVISFFGGIRFVPIISAITYIIVGLIMYRLWPSVQNGIFVLGGMVANSGYAGTFVFGVIKRLLLPFGLHHVFYLPFWQTALGGAMSVDGSMIYGAQNIFFAQLASPSTIQFSNEATKYFTGEFIYMMFGLPGAALAIYHCAKSENKKMVGSLMLSAAFTSILTGITEPVEFSFLFVAPLLFGVHVLLAGGAYVIAQLLSITIGLTFSAGLFDFVVFGVLQGNSKTNWLLIIPIGIIYFGLYYGLFRYLIVKLDLKTPGRSDNKLIDLKEQDDDFVIDLQAQKLVRGLGGRDNFSDVDSCVTRVRALIEDVSKINEGILKQSGAAAVVLSSNTIQIIYGPKASLIKSNLDDYLANTTVEDDLLVEQEVTTMMELGNIVDGQVIGIETSSDDIFANKIMGDGILIKPYHGLIVAPCLATVTMVYPTKHAIGLQLDNGCEILLHFGIDTVNLAGQGFTVLVKEGQRVQKGDPIWNVDLDYVKSNATSEDILLVFTNLPKRFKIEKNYGEVKRGDTIIIVDSDYEE